MIRWFLSWFTGQSTTSFLYTERERSIYIYWDGKKDRKRVTISGASEEFKFECRSKPVLVNVDAEKMLVCIKKDNHTREEWIYQYHHAPLYLDRYEAIYHAGLQVEKDSLYGQVIMDALNDPLAGIRAFAVSSVSKSMKSKYRLKEKLMTMAGSDPKSKVRAVAIHTLEHFYDDKDLNILYKEATNDSSYEVIERALKALVKNDSLTALQMARKFEETDDEELLTIISSVYARSGSDPENNFFVNAIAKASGGEIYRLVSDYGVFLLRCKNEILEGGIKIIEEKARYGEPWWVRLSAIHTLSALQDGLESKEKEVSKKMNALKKDDQGKAALEKDSGLLKTSIEKIDSLVETIKKEEKDKNLRKIFDGGK